MSQVQVVLGVALALITLVGLLATLWRAADRAVLKTSNETLRNSNTDLLARLNYVEPQLAAALEQNRVLQELHNPKQQLEGLAETLLDVVHKVDGVAGEAADISRKQTATIALLNSQERRLVSAVRRAHIDPEAIPDEDR